MDEGGQIYKRNHPHCRRSHTSPKGAAGGAGAGQGEDDCRSLSIGHGAGLSESLSWARFTRRVTSLRRQSPPKGNTTASIVPRSGTPSRFNSRATSWVGLLDHAGSAQDWRTQLVR
jgi:hypothetical protein